MSTFNIEHLLLVLQELCMQIRCDQKFNIMNAKKKNICSSPTIQHCLNCFSVIIIKSKCVINSNIEEHKCQFSTWNLVLYYKLYRRRRDSALFKLFLSYCNQIYVLLMKKQRRYFPSLFTLLSHLECYCDTSLLNNYFNESQVN